MRYKKLVRIISRAKIIEFSTLHAKAKAALEYWYVVMKKTSFDSFNDLRKTYPSADKVRLKSGRELTIFNIMGNNFRLICAIHYNSQMVFIREILTHSEYNKENWKRLN
jgi:mRNA interferase HigB